MLIYLQLIETEEDRSKFETIYLSYRDLMYHAAFGILRNVEDAEDAVHHAFVKIAEHMEKVGEAGLECSGWYRLLDYRSLPCLEHLYSTGRDSAE